MSEEIIDLERYVDMYGGIVLLIDKRLDFPERVDFVIENMKIKSSDIVPFLYNTRDLNSLISEHKKPIIFVPIDEHLVCNLRNYPSYPVVYYVYGSMQSTEYVVMPYNIDDLLTNISINLNSHVIIPAGEFDIIKSKLDDLAIKYEVTEYGFEIHRDLNNSELSELHIVKLDNMDEILEWVDSFISRVNVVYLYYSNLASKNTSLILKAMNDSALSYMSHVEYFDTLSLSPGNVVKRRK